MTPTTDTPRTDACPHCGESDCKPYYRAHGQECRSPLCEMTERAKKAEAEVERLKEERNRIGVEIRGEYIPKLKKLEAEAERLREALKAWTTVD